MQYHNLGLLVVGGIGIHLRIVLFILYDNKMFIRKMGLLLNLLAKISQIELSKFCSMIFVRLGLKILCGDFGEFFIIFVACESFYHV